MADVAIITASYGGYDSLKPVLKQRGIDAEWVVVSDDPCIAPIDSGWRTVYRPAPDGVSNYRASRHPKLFPWMYTDAPASIWIDGSVIVNSPDFASQAIPAANSIAQFGHCRDCIYQEAKFSEKLLKYRGEPMQAQCNFYREKGHPEHWGLWATTVIARRHTAEMVSLSYYWEREIMVWSNQDQISQPYILRNFDIRPHTFPGSVEGKNPWITYDPSLSHFNPADIPYGFWDNLI